MQLLRARADCTPEREGWSFLDGAGEVTTRASYAALEMRARAIAASLAEVCDTKERALLLYPPGMEFVAGLFGCFFAGIVAIPAFPPEPARLKRGLPRLEAIAQDAGCNVVLTTRSLAQLAQGVLALVPALAKMRWIASDEITDATCATWRDPGVRPDDVAFLQYTSGSTGTPKGVMVTHANLIHNSTLITRFFGFSEHSRAVIWLPPYHDMGLIGGVLQPLYAGFPVALMSPLTFLQRPIRWLEAMSHHHATTSGGPDFAYRMCIQKITEEQKCSLDLSSWDVAFTGAEPVRADTLDRFTQTFASCGFRREAFYPCYGLAEATLIVTGGQRHAPPIVNSFDRAALARGEARVGAGVKLVACGASDPEQRVQIVDPITTRQLADHRVGEIWCAGPSVAGGYWRRDAESAETFGARLEGGDGPYLRTGDLGFFCDGQLYVAGRIKDVMIVRGRNIYPQDVEHSIEALGAEHGEIRAGGVCAFSEDQGEETVVVAVESKRAADPDVQRRLVDAIATCVADAHGIEVARVVFLCPGVLPKTSSGKLQRHATREQLANGTLETVASITPRAGNAPVTAALANGAPHTRDEIQAWLVRYAAERMHVEEPRIDVEAPFTRYGLDSIEAVALATRLGDHIGRPLSPTLLWNHPSIAALAAHVASLRPGDLAGSEPSARNDAPVVAPTDDGNGAIAIVGLACRFPGGADDPSQFWVVLRDGVDAIAKVPSDRPDCAAVAACGYEGGFVHDVDAFDAGLFGIAPREASAMDPQQRIVLECAWEALERAGYAPTALAGSPTGVFVGISNVDYMRLQVQHGTPVHAYVGTGNAPSVAANRLSYVLDLRGPSMAIDTACSSSLVAVHLACRSLRSRESSLALVAGVNLILSAELTRIFDEARMLAPDSRCKTFDARADGYVRGEGCAVMVLKRLSDAQRDGDRVLAVVRGTAVNQDGRSNGLTAPNGAAQRAVIRAALDDARVAPTDISYVEAHGTGTPLGDPIEVEALSDALAGAVCAIGSVKTNIGHLEAAAGIAGLMKVTLALGEGTIPPHLHLRTRNPRIALPQGFSIPSELTPWS
ncbi:MAG TPA: beta-ketoacyl synthase N-terminal-like domain-containing protein, partial [Kofleriaceae bacterium]